nr:FAD-dependent oxidoreductase [Actinomycetes bacterium]
RYANAKQASVAQGPEANNGRRANSARALGDQASSVARQPREEQELLRLSVGHIINCAGLQADRVAQWFDMCPDYQVVPFKGMYRYGNWPPFQLQRLVYPVPDPRNPFLGVHVTTTVTGATKIGPTAVPVLGRNNYHGLQGLATAELVDTLRGLASFARSREQDAIALTRSELPKYATRVLAREAAELVPGIRAQDFTRKGEPGIRAQLVNKATGGLEMDFLVRGDQNSTHVLNAVSPAWTSSLAVAEHVVAGLAGR